MISNIVSIKQLSFHSEQHTCKLTFPQNNIFEKVLWYFRKVNIIKEKFYEVALV